MSDATRAVSVEVWMFGPKSESPAKIYVGTVEMLATANVMPGLSVKMPKLKRPMETLAPPVFCKTTSNVPVEPVDLRAFRSHHQ